MFNTKFYIEYSNKYTNSCYLLFFLEINFKLETEVIIDPKSVLVTESSKFGATTILMRLLPSHVDKFPFQKFQFI